MAGLRLVIGGLGLGKTTAVRNACRQAIAGAISYANTSFRPILYLDLQRYGDRSQNVQDILSLLRDRSREVSPSSGTTLFSNVWPVARANDGTAPTPHLLSQLFEIIDSNRMVLVVDHVADPTESFWKQFLEGAKSLARSAVIAILEDPKNINIDNQHLLQVHPFTSDDIARYIATFHGDQQSCAQDLFEASGGVPLLLDLSMKSLYVAKVVDMKGRPQEQGQILERARALVSGLPAPDRIVLTQLAYLPNGLNLELAWNYVSEWRDADVLGLVQRGLLISEYRSSTRWLRIPRLVADTALGSFAAEAEAAPSSLGSIFLDQIDGTPEQVEHNLLGLAALVGGLDFLHDIHSLLVKLDWRDQFRTIPVFLQEWLFRRGRWNDALEFWNRTLEALPLAMTKAEEWIWFASAAHKLGFAPRAMDYIAKAEDRTPSALDRIDIMLLRAAILKDSADISKLPQVRTLYSSALSAIDDEESGADQETKVALRNRHAMTLYNRALHLRYWENDLPSALADLAEAGKEFAKLSNRLMRALADCEWAEIQLGIAGGKQDWDQLLKRLVDADSVFGLESAIGDRAFCSYQIARFYRKKPPADEAETRVNIRNARDAYRTAAEQAAAAGDLRQQQIAEVHIVEISYFSLHEISSEEAYSRLSNTIQLLRTFDGDAWSHRVLRDALLLRSHLQTPASSDALKEALYVASSSPLNPLRGKDARRAATILHEYLDSLAKANNLLTLEKEAASKSSLVEAWLGHSVSSIDYRTWLKDVHTFSLG